MAKTAAAPADEPGRHWGLDKPQVREALEYIKAKGSISAEQLVDWDAANGRRLFTWQKDKAAAQWRLEEARFFLNRFRAKFEGMRVRAFIHIHEDTDAGIDQAAYYPVEEVSQHPGMRAQVLADIARRMTGLASELKMWKLNEVERQRLMERLAAAMAE